MASRGRRKRRTISRGRQRRPTASKWLDIRGKAAEGGSLSGEQLLIAIDFCLRTGRRVPPHLATEFCSRLVEFWTYRAKSLDQAFGVSRKGKHLGKERQYHALVIPITARIEQRHRSGQPIDIRMREAVANEFRLTYSRVKDIYERGLKELPWIAALLKTLETITIL
jgi:hypothetical protein